MPAKHKAAVGPMSFCSQCGGALDLSQIEGKQRHICRECGRVHYENPKLAVAVIVSQGEKVLLGKRSMHPGRGDWSFPSGYVDRGEKVEEAAVREVKEETGLEVSLTGLVGLYSTQGEPVVLAVYAGEIVGGVLKLNDELTEVDYFPLQDLPKFAFSHDRQILEDWSRFLKDLNEAARLRAQRT